MDVNEQKRHMVEAMQMSIAEVEIAPAQIAQTPEIKRNAGINAELGNIALAGSVLESSYSFIESSTQTLRNIFEKHGEKVDINHYEISIPDDQYLLVEATQENFVVSVGGWTLNDTKLRKFTANKLSYTHGGAYGHYVEANLFAKGPGNTRVQIKAGHKLSLRKLPEGTTLEEFLATSSES